MRFLLLSIPFLVILFSHEGHKTYVIAAGGSSTLGAWGYIDGFHEMMQQVCDSLSEYKTPLEFAVILLTPRVFGRTLMASLWPVAVLALCVDWPWAST